MLIPIEQLLTILIGECYSRRNTIFVFFAVISLTCLASGTVWPKKFTSFAIIHIDESNILQPLMRGAAETTQTMNHLSNAREIIFGETIMEQIMQDSGWLDESPSEIDQERIKNGIKSRINIDAVGESLLRIEYLDTNAMRTFTNKKFS